MNILSWLRAKIGGAVSVSVDSGAFGDEIAGLWADVYIRELCFWSAVNLIANAVSKCEFKTYLQNDETRGREHYLWNVEPNKNQNASEFVHKWIAQLYRNNECLVIENDGQLLVADSYELKPYALYEDIFSEVTVKDFTFSRSFRQSEVLHFKLASQDMRQVINGIYTSYAKLLAYSMKAFQKSRGNRGILDVSGIAQGKTNFQETFEALMNDRFKKFFSSENAVLPLFEGYEYKELGSKTYGQENTRDIRAMVDDISDFTAKAFGIPPSLLRGDVQDTTVAMDQLLTFCVDPLANLLATEINRKRNGFEGFSQGTYIKIDTKAIKHVDLLSVGSGIDKIIGSGAFCINDIRKVCGEPIIDEPWAWQHFMTKNYSTVADMLVDLEGGETD